MANRFQYSAHQFSLFRIIFGSFLFTYFTFLFIFAQSSKNQAEASLSNFSGIIDNHFQLSYVALALALLCIFIMIGYFRRTAALLVLPNWIIFFHDSNTIFNLGVPLIGGLLLAIGLTPNGEPIAISKAKNQKPWTMPIYILHGSWLLMISLFFIICFSKIAPKNWQNEMGFPSFVYNNLTIAGAFLINLFLFDSRWFSKQRNATEHPVVLFDGVCGLCNKWVDFLIQNDFSQNFRYAPLQSDYAKEHLSKEIITQMNTVVLFYKGKTYIKSTAALLAFRQIGGIWIFTQIGFFTPRTIRDFFYDQISKNRYRFFGKHETCRIPSPEEKKLFL